MKIVSPSTFKPISKGPTYPKKHHKLEPKRNPEQQIVGKMGVQKNTKKLAANKSSTLPKLSQIGDPRGGQSAAKF